MIPKNCINKKTNKPFPSERRFKKLQVCVKTKEGKIKNIHFGDNRYEDFTEHKDERRRRSFRARHRCDEELNKESARFWACNELW